MLIGQLMMTLITAATSKTNYFYLLPTHYLLTMHFSTTLTLTYPGLGHIDLDLSRSWSHWPRLIQVSVTINPSAGYFHVLRCY